MALLCFTALSLFLSPYEQISKLKERLKKEKVKISVRTVRKGKSKGKSFQDTTKIRLKLPM